MTTNELLAMDERPIIAGNETTLTNDLCNEVRDLRERLEQERALHIISMRAHASCVHLLTAVLDAGRPHSHLCGCDGCNAWLAVRKELRGE